MKLTRLSRLAAAAAISALAASAGLVISAPNAFAVVGVTVAPTSGWTDALGVHISGNFGASSIQPLQFIECPGTTIPPTYTDATGCDGNTFQSLGNTDASGNFTSKAVTFYTLPGAADASPTFQCNYANPCIAYVGQDHNNFASAHTWLLMNGWQAPPPTPNPPTGTVTGPYSLPYSATGATVSFNPSANLTAKDSNNTNETINTPTVTAVGTPVGGLVCASATSCTYTGVGATTTAYTDSFSLAFTATTTDSTHQVSTSASFSPYSITVGAKPTYQTSASNPVETILTSTIPAGTTTLPVTPGSTGGFHAGDFIVINPGGADAEVLGPLSTIGSASLDPPMTKNPHTAGELIVDQSNSSVQQIVQIPTQGASITITEPTGTGGAPPIDILNVTTTQIPGSGETCQGVNGGGNHVLTGQPFFACGALAPVTIVNARGTDTPWSVTGQVTDFLDSVATPGYTCDTIATFNDHCIPGGNLQWGPVAAVSHDLVPGDVGAIAAGPALANVPYSSATTAAETNPALAGAKTNNFGAALGTSSSSVGSPVVKGGWSSSGTFGIAPVAGITGGGVTLCSTSSGTAGGTFTCGADLMVAVPASASAMGSPYQATLTLTLA